MVSAACIDMRQFMSQPSAEVGTWRDEVIVPKYEKAGVKKIAWVWPGDPYGPGTSVAGDDDFVAGDATVSDEQPADRAFFFSPH
jgi:hypothetical protein